jgi:hypothetical protein
MEPITTERIVQYLHDHDMSPIGMMDKNGHRTTIVSLPMPPPDLSNTIESTVLYRVGDGNWMQPETFEKTYLQPTSHKKLSVGARLREEWRRRHKK